MQIKNLRNFCFRRIARFLAMRNEVAVLRKSYRSITCRALCRTPVARLYRKGNTTSELRYMGHRLSNNRHGLIASAVGSNKILAGPKWWATWPRWWYGGWRKSIRCLCWRWPPTTSCACAPWGKSVCRGREEQERPRNGLTSAPKGAKNEDNIRMRKNPKNQ